MISGTKTCDILSGDSLEPVHQEGSAYRRSASEIFLEDLTGTKILSNRGPSGIKVGLDREMRT